MKYPSAFIFIVAFSLVQQFATADNIVSTSVSIQGNLQDIQWLSENGRIVLLVTDEGFLYHSSDEGGHWELQNIKFNRVGDESLIEKIYISKANHLHVFAVGRSKYSYLSKDGGVTWEESESEFRLTEVSLNPIDPNLILTTALTTKCNGAQKDMEGNCHKRLYISKDWGKTWKTIRKYVVQADWLANCGYEGVPVHEIAATVFENEVGEQLFGYWDVGINFVTTDSEFATEKMVVKGGNKFLFSDSYILVAHVMEERKNEVMLKVSSDCGRTFVTGTLPFPVEQYSYTVLDTSEDQIFLHVTHDEHVPFGNVYISGADGHNFTKSLANNMHASDGTAEFEKVRGMEGIYLANFVENAAEILQQSKVSAGKTQKPKSHKGHRLKSKIRTVITFDKGGEWKFIPSPAVDSLGAPISCTAGVACHLNLHSVSSRYGPFYSTDSATGIILATGNVGPFLESSVGNTNTYFSRNGGLEWFEVRKGSRIYEIGDHGGLLVMARDTEETTTIEYSWNEGLTWDVYQFSDVAMMVENIIIEPSSKSQKFLVYGSKNGQGLLHMIDFSPLHERVCSGSRSPGQRGSDYEFWTPSDGRAGEQCVLGHSIEYSRRKRDSACFNPVGHTRIVNMEHCKCTVFDYECDVGYTRKVDGGPCTLSKDAPASAKRVIPEYCPPGSTYAISSGYRKVAGNTCAGGDDFNPHYFDCPGMGFLGVGIGGWFVLLVLLCLAIGSFVMTYNSMLSMKQNLRAFGTQHFGESTGIWFKIKSFFKQMMGREDDAYQKVGEEYGGPDCAMDYEYNQYSEFDNDEGFDIHDDDNVAELIPATTSAKPLPGPHQEMQPVSVPRLNQPRSGVDFVGGDEV